MTTASKPYSSRYQRAVKRVLRVKDHAERLLGSLAACQYGGEYEASLVALIHAADREIAALARSERLAVAASN